MYLGDKFKVITYDFDGVLVDSEEAVFKFYSILNDRFDLGIDFNDNECRSRLLMLSTDKALEFLCKDKALIREIKEYINTENFDSLASYIKLKPYVKFVLKSIYNQYKLAILSNRDASLHYILDYLGIKNYFDYVLSCKDVSEPKPSPEGLLKIINYFGIKSDEMLYIGDRVIDEHAAINARVPFLYFGSGNNSISNHLELLLSNLDVIIKK